MLYIPRSHLHYVCGGVSRDAISYGGSPLSLVLLLPTRVSFHMSANARKLYMYKQSQSPSNSHTHTHPPAFPLPL